MLVYECMCFFSRRTTLEGLEKIFFVAGFKIHISNCAMTFLSIQKPKTINHNTFFLMFRNFYGFVNLL